MPQINPEVLVWARVTAGLSVEEAAKKLGLSGPERLRAIETGERAPTRRQLVNMSGQYHRPLLAFYLPNPPRENAQGQDFRSLPAGHEPSSEAILRTLVRDVQARQQLVRAAMEETDEAEQLGFVNSARMSSGIDPLVRSIRETLGVSLDQFRAEKSVTDAFAVLRAGAEKAGVFVLLMGNLGTHHTDIDVRIFRGFAIADDVAPFVVINEKDSRAAWSFTLLHELAHIWLGQTGISGYDSEVDVERFCDTVAARFLLAPAELEQIQVSARDIAQLKEHVSVFAGERNLSRKMVAYNLLRSNAITRSIYARLSEAFDNDRINQKKDQDASDGGPNYYTVRAHRIGQGLIGVVRRMVAARALSTTKAAKVLGIKPTAVDRLIGVRRAA